MASKNFGLEIKDKFIPVDVFKMPMVVIGHVGQYMLVEKELLEWLARCTPDYRMEGMVITFGRYEDRTAFLLAWQ